MNKWRTNMLESSCSFQHVIQQGWKKIASNLAFVQQNQKLIRWWMGPLQTQSPISLSFQGYKL